MVPVCRSPWTVSHVSPGKQGKQTCGTRDPQWISGRMTLVRIIFSSMARRRSNSWMVAGSQVEETYELVDGDELEFVKPSGTKG